MDYGLAGILSALLVAIASSFIFFKIIKPKPISYIVKAIFVTAGVFCSLSITAIGGLLTFVKGSGRTYYVFSEMYLQTSLYSICFIFIMSFITFYIFKKIQS